MKHNGGGQMEEFQGVGDGKNTMGKGKAIEEDYDGVAFMREEKRSAPEANLAGGAARDAGTWGEEQKRRKKKKNGKKPSV